MCVRFLWNLQLASDLLELELQAVAKPLMWVLGCELGPYLAFCCVYDPAELISLLVLCRQQP